MQLGRQVAEVGFAVLISFTLPLGESASQGRRGFAWRRPRNLPPVTRFPVTFCLRRFELVACEFIQLAHGAIFLVTRFDEFIDRNTF